MKKNDRVYVPHLDLHGKLVSDEVGADVPDAIAAGSYFVVDFDESDGPPVAVESHLLESA